MRNHAILILAAGESKRFGGIKQIHPWHGKPLLQHTIDACLSTGSDVYLALGANREAIESKINAVGTRILFAQCWVGGMGNTISESLHKMLNWYPYQFVTLCVGDQPYLTPYIISNLRDKVVNSTFSIIASSYGSGFGVPVCFSKNHFDELLNLRGNTGAKSVINAHLKNTLLIPFANGEKDIDYQSDIDETYLT